MELEDFLLENIHKVIEYSINRELEIADDFLKLPETMSARNISNKMATPKMESYKFISYNSHLKYTEEDEKSKYKIIRKIYEEYKKLKEIYSLISEFKTLVQITRGENTQTIFDVRNGKIHVDDCHIADEIHENFGDFIRDRIEFARNFVLFNKNEFIDIFLNRTMDECKKICDWFEVSMDRSIIGGIFLSRDFFDEEDRQAIIENAIKATVIHNTDLLKLKGTKLVNWLVIGSR